MRVLITQPIPLAAVTLLKENNIDVDVHDKEVLSYEQLTQKAKDYSGLVTMLSDKIDAKFLENNSHLKVIANYAVGTNNIDVAAATKIGIKVGNTPDVLTNATADLALALLMGVSRNLLPAAKSVKDGKWSKWEPLGFRGVELKGKTLGIFGAGRIGQCFAKKCKTALGMNILYSSRSQKSDFETSYDAQKVSFEKLLEQSDVLSLHCPLTDQTKGLMDVERFQQMKTGSILINTARGELCDQSALFEVLRSNHLYGAGLDVTTPEPLPADSPLLSLENILILPHIGSATFSTREEMAKLAAHNIIAGLNSRQLIAEVVE